MINENDYIYAWELLENKEVNEKLQNYEINELQNREEPIYYYNFNHPFVDYSDDNRIKLHVDEAIDYRYQIHTKLGKGTFGTVYRCTDHKWNLDVAVKVVRNEKRFHKQAKIEMQIYDLFNEPTGDGNKEYVINMIKGFHFRNDIYMVFPNFGIDLYNYYKKNDIPIEDVKGFGNQIARGLSFIHSFNIIHMDLKPENILIRDKHLKIIDLGSSIIKEDNKSLIKDYIQSRYYRSPEVIFKLDITSKIDIWSFGCILYELFTKTPLFPAKCMGDLSIMHIHVLGYPLKSIEDIYKNETIFTKSKELRSYKIMNGRLLYPRDFLWEKKIGENLMFKQLLIVNCLMWDSKSRSTAEELLEHPFFMT